MKESVNMHTIRLKPGQDLKKGLLDFITLKNIQAGWVMSCAGSLTHYHLRFANREKGSNGSGFFEIVTLSGTLSIHGSHLHIGISDGEGTMIGGHLLEGSIVYTTAEIVIGDSPGSVFMREKDESTGFNELQVRGNDET